jgi:putative FmdB family regulatory protein
VPLLEPLQPNDSALQHRNLYPHHAGDSTLGHVPIYEYACMECESHFDELVRNSEQAVVCPECGAANVLKQM